MNDTQALAFIRDDDTNGRFSRDWEGEEKVDDLREQLNSGSITLEAAVMAARGIVRREPDNLDAQQFLAVNYWETGLKVEAADLWATLFERVSALIPPTFKGLIEWNELDNRPFLRLAHGHLLGLMHVRDAKAASKLCKKMLAWCPNDNLGVRYLRPLIELMGGHYKTAYKQFLKIAPDQPNGWYHAARIAFIEERYVTALTHLRRGVLANPYIAEVITGRRVLFDHLQRHLSNLADHSMAESFLEDEFDGWGQEEIDFVDWGFNCASVMRERTVAAQINEGLTYEHRHEVRRQFHGMSDELESLITDKSSLALIQKVVNRDGQECWPWDRVALLFPRHRGHLSAEEAAFMREIGPF